MQIAKRWVPVIIAYYCCIIVTGFMVYSQKSASYSEILLQESIALITDFTAVENVETVKTLKSMTQNQSSPKDIIAFLKEKNIKIKKLNSGLLVRFPNDSLAQFSLEAEFSAVTEAIITFLQTKPSAMTLTQVREKYPDLTDLEIWQKLKSKYQRFNVSAAESRFAKMMHEWQLSFLTLFGITFVLPGVLYIGGLLKPKI